MMLECIPATGWEARRIMPNHDPGARVRLDRRTCLAWDEYENSINLLYTDPSTGIEDVIARYYRSGAVEVHTVRNCRPGVLNRVKRVVPLGYKYERVSGMNILGLSHGTAYWTLRGWRVATAMGWRMFDPDGGCGGLSRDVIEQEATRALVEGEI